MCVKVTGASTFESSSSAADTVTSCRVDQFDVVKLSISGDTVRSPDAPPTVTVTGPVGSASSTTA